MDGYQQYCNKMQNFSRVVGSMTIPDLTELIDQFAREGESDFSEEDLVLIGMTKTLLENACGDKTLGTDDSALREIPNVDVREKVLGGCRSITFLMIYNYFKEMKYKNLPRGMCVAGWASALKTCIHSG